MFKVVLIFFLGLAHVMQVSTVVNGGKFIHDKFFVCHTFIQLETAQFK